ncbi:MAG: hypothetical protein PHU56_00735 [Candidatus Pacebacteria bacterium]|nr:hypothetical protein [Candidatus Paceibacterota bacterium]
MARKSKIFFIVFFFLVLAGVGVSFCKYFVLKDYYIRAEVECDPRMENCFMAECDPLSDDECPESPDERISYYKIVEKKAYDIPLCDSDSPDCQPFTCGQSDNCREIFCDETARPEGASCSNPGMF